MINITGQKRGLRLQSVIVFMVFSLFAGCKTIQTPVPLYGLESETTLLTGDWYGVYESRESGRHGIIHFSLESEADSASGHIIMKPGSWEDEYDLDQNFLFDNPSELLTIRFVSIGRGRIVGRLDEYRDPACGCLLETIFEGHLSDNRIEGVYLTHSEGFHLDTAGNWSVERVSTAAHEEKVHNK